ncbi:hypothetical protein LS482_16280 [Sinomicrobium kalidii]|uniref:hypothetical protein n=1 Tax=Sinomicrobium kalidii TaxID=2900738 RepID=UPI001E5656A0|nr:hypothetical protein [Sinomicrobium kalidii]UGU15231.1 hypothetical protein LS482_16280 [Sinomicrobium kalidii]
MKKLRLDKLKLKAEDILQKEDMRAILGGSGSDCPDGQFQCSCNGTSYGCVSSVQECWNKC